MQSVQINELAAALSKAQGMMACAGKDSANPFFKSKYASLDAVREAIKTPFSSNGLAYSQMLFEDGDWVMLEMILMHSSGQYLSSKISVCKKDAPPQVRGSAASYMRRYTLSAIAGVTTGEDDDANVAQTYHTEQAEKKKSDIHEVISGEEARDLELSISGEDREEYLKNILAHFKVRSFEELPRKKLESCLRAIERRKTMQSQKVGIA